jgi:putative ABC transport system permease protein
MGATAENGARLEQSLRAFPTAKVETRDEFRHRQLGSLKRVVHIFYALLGLSVLVSMFGVINTSSCGCSSGRARSACCAVGMTRRQVRWMVRHESIVTALIGAALGMAVGIFLVGLTSTALSKYGLVFALPYKSLAAFVVVAILAGMLAAILPARRLEAQRPRSAPVRATPSRREAASRSRVATTSSASMVVAIPAT